MGFPSPASDYLENSLDLNELCVSRPAATFFMTVEGHALHGAGIFHGDTLVVDRSVKAAHGQFVVAVVDGEMVLRELRFRPRLALVPHHPNYKILHFEEGMDLEVWGVVRSVIRNMLANQ